MKDMLAGVGTGALCGLLFMLFFLPKTSDKPRKNLLTDSQQELIDNLCTGVVTLTCKDGKTIGVKNGN